MNKSTQWKKNKIQRFLNEGNLEKMVLLWSDFANREGIDWRDETVEINLKIEVNKE